MKDPVTVNQTTIQVGDWIRFISRDTHRLIIAEVRYISWHASNGMWMITDMGEVAPKNVLEIRREKLSKVDGALLVSPKGEK